MFPFEGHLVNEGLGALLAFRLSRLIPLSLSIAVNDYGLELVSDQEIPTDRFEDLSIFNTDNLLEDILESVNAAEMGRRQFREIGRIAVGIRRRGIRVGTRQLERIGRGPDHVVGCTVDQVVSCCAGVTQLLTGREAVSVERELTVCHACRIDRRCRRCIVHRVVGQQLNDVTRIEDLDDVQSVYANFDIPDEVLASLD